MCSNLIETKLINYKCFDMRSTEAPVDIAETLDHVGPECESRAPIRLIETLLP
jgi:hypothetical protein